MFVTFEDNDREKAKAIICGICGIIRQSGGSFTGKVRLYKAFYLANLFYAEMKQKWLEELTDWPMVRMPNGPGIDDGTKLLEELKEEKCIKIFKQKSRNYTEYSYEFINPSKYRLNVDEQRAISQAVKTIGEHTGSTLSHWSHEFCNTWKHFKNGERINIYHDLMTEKDFLRMREANEWAKHAISEILCDEL